MLLKQSMFAVGISRYFLVPLGIWPSVENTPLVVKFLNYLAVLCNYLLILFVVVPCSMHTFLEDLDLSVKLKLIGPINLWIMCMSKYASLIKCTHGIGSCFQHIEEDWRRFRLLHVILFHSCSMLFRGYIYKKSL